MIDEQTNDTNPATPAPDGAPVDTPAAPASDAPADAEETQTEGGETEAPAA